MENFAGVPDLLSIHNDHNYAWTIQDSESPTSAEVEDDELTHGTYKLYMRSVCENGLTTENNRKTLRLVFIRTDISDPLLSRAGAAKVSTGSSNATVAAPVTFLDAPQSSTAQQSKSKFKMEKQNKSGNLIGEKNEVKDSNCKSVCVRPYIPKQRRNNANINQLKGENHYQFYQTPGPIDESTTFSGKQTSEEELTLERVKCSNDSIHSFNEPIDQTEKGSEDQRAKVHHPQSLKVVENSNHTDHQELKGDKTIRIRHQCHYCEKSYVKKAQWENHEQSHVENLPFPCRYNCGMTFLTYKSAAAHNMDHIQEKLFKCQFCYKRFSFKLSLSRHERIHTKEEVCPYCGLKFKTETDRKCHEDTHDINRPYQCSKCDHTFKTLVIARRHAKLAHSDENKSHECKLCGEKFAFQCKLKRHLLVHLGVKTHKCQKCDKSYWTAYDLKRHDKVTHLYFVNRSIAKIIQKYVFQDTETNA